MAVGNTDTGPVYFEWEETFRIADKRENKIATSHNVPFFLLQKMYPATRAKENKINKQKPKPTTKLPSSHFFLS